MKLKALLFSLSPLLLLPADGRAQAQDKLPPGPNVELVEQKCQICHELEHIKRSRMSRERWVDTLKLMRERGAPIDDAETARILDYLAATFGEEKK